VLPNAFFALPAADRFPSICLNFYERQPSMLQKHDAVGHSIYSWAYELGRETPIDLTVSTSFASIAFSRILALH
jgi:hypothetical protein